MKRVVDVSIDDEGSQWSKHRRNSSMNTIDCTHMRSTEDKRNNIGITRVTVKTLADEKETDPHRLAQRQKQIDYGKNTIGYDRYCAHVPKLQRRPGKHPMTPDKTMRVGKKVFDRIVRKWRQALHKYDPPELAEAMKTIVPANCAAVTVDAMAKSVDDGAAKSVRSAEGAIATASTEANVQNTTRPQSKCAIPSRSIYENFDEGNFDDDDVESDDDLL